MITKLNNRELFQFCEQFSIILRSGMSAIEGLAILNDDSQTERGKEILTFLYKDMEESGSLAHAMEQSGAFPASAAARDVHLRTLPPARESRRQHRHDPYGCGLCGDAPLGDVLYPDDRRR